MILSEGYRLVTQQIKITTINMMSEVTYYDLTCSLEVADGSLFEQSCILLTSLLLRPIVGKC